jgi:hypothetical protein
MEKPFEEQLQDFLDQHADVPLDEKISAFELSLMALKEQEAQTADD